MKGKLYDPKHPGRDRGYIIIEAEEVSKSKRNVKYVFIYFFFTFFHLYYLVHLLTHIFLFFFLKKKIRLQFQAHNISPKVRKNIFLINFNLIMI
jgi:hypothetical protein